MEIPDIDASTVVGLLASLGSLNWALIEWGSFDLIAELLGSNPEIGYAAFGLAGLVSITERFEITEMFD